MIAWSIETLAATTLLMLLVLAIRNPVRRAFGPDMAYALWLLPVLRMVLPPLPESWRGRGVAPLADASQQMIQYVVEPLAEAPAGYLTGEGVPWAEILLASWAIGAIGFVAYHWVSHRRFCAVIRKRARSGDWMAGGRVEMIESAAANGPIAFGILRKTVALPCDFAERYDDAERDLALAHELGHHARGDLIANWVALVMLGLHWFNPVAWKAYRAFRADQEMACDALVLAGREPSLRHAYGLAIVKSAHGGTVSAACHFHTINDLKGRLKMLLDNRERSRGRVFGGAAFNAAMSVAALGLTASGTQAAETIKTGVEDRIGMRFDDVALPSLPSLPSPPGQEAFVVPAPPVRAPIVPPQPEMDQPDQPIITRLRPTADKAEIDQTAARADTTRLRAAQIIADVERRTPQVIERNCGTDGTDARDLIGKEHDGDRPRLIICKDRIDKMAAHAPDHGARAKVLALSSARVGNDMARMNLRHARRAIEFQAELTADQRAQALAGVDQAMAELDTQKHD